MLETVHIQNIALLDDVDVEFSGGLNIVSGETGSGKSILVQAISGLLVIQLGKEQIRSNDKPAVIEGEFSGTISSRLNTIFADSGLDITPGEPVSLRREILPSGRNRYLVNDQSIPKRFFQEIGHSLLDVNSQHEHQQLLDTKQHLTLLDKSLSLEGETEKLVKSHRKLTALTQKISNLEETQRTNIERRKLLEYQIAEIDEANLVPGEKNALVEEVKRLRNADALKSQLDDILQLCLSEDGSLRDQSGSLVTVCKRILQNDPGFAKYLDQAESISLLIEDLALEIRTLRQNTDWSQNRLEDLTTRLHILQDLEARYQNDIEGIIAYRASIEKDLSGFKNLSDDVITQKEEWFAEYEAYLAINQKLGNARREGLPGLIKKIEKLLHEVGMTRTRFDVKLTPDPAEIEKELHVTETQLPEICSHHGTDHAEFLLSANPGLPLLPLSKVASGGELSRIMLALKHHFIPDDVMTVIFDEVDAGIGGRTADAVARQIKRLAGKKQILCVTHLAPIAVYADRHIAVKKILKKNTTHVTIKPLDRNGSIEEIARMIAGDQVDQPARKLAESLLAKAACE
jgi:DNA repair protein RecN (Recombination protein N)